MQHAYDVSIALKMGQGGSHTSRLSHIISVLVIPIEFPRLLAKREIIANALFLRKKYRTRLAPSPFQKYKKVCVTPAFWRIKNSGWERPAGVCVFARAFWRVWLLSLLP